MDRFISMFINVVMRRLINAGINKGMNAMSKPRKPQSKKQKPSKLERDTLE